MSWKLTQAGLNYHNKLWFAFDVNLSISMQNIEKQGWVGQWARVVIGKSCFFLIYLQSFDFSYVFFFTVNRKLFETIHVLNLSSTHWIHKTPLIQGLNWELSIWTRQRVLWKTTQHSNTADIATQQLTNTATGAQQLRKLQHSSRDTETATWTCNLIHNATWKTFNTATWYTMQPDTQQPEIQCNLNRIQYSWKDTAQIGLWVQL